MIDALRGQTDRPLLVPVFGRGRMLDAIPCERFDDQVVMQACRFMVSECSCTVKSLNPGSDLLLRVNWRQALGSDRLLVGPVISESPVLVDIPGGGSEDHSAPAPSPLSAVKGLPPADRQVGWAMGVGALLIIAAWFTVIWSRRTRNLS
jgi:hypothetical protein